MTCDNLTEGQLDELGLGEFLLCEAFLKIFAGRLFAFAVRELIKIQH